MATNTTTSQTDDCKAANLARICAETVEGFDVVIVCTSNQSLEDYWQARLEGGAGVLAKGTVTCVVHEDWEGGAGNGLGTLYAFHKANKQYESKVGKTLLDAMKTGPLSVALYHTAGKGTRLSPLPGSESNNKPGVKLPGMVSVNQQSECITILEAVIKQTGLYASSRKGRLSVFWGDQIFIPTVSTSYTPTHHADILAMLGSFPSAKEWEERGLESFGLIAVNEEGNAAQLEKVTHATASKLLGGMGTMKSVGTSLGSFSVSSEMLSALLTEYSKELAAKKGKFDTDPHFWMPLTLPQQGYVELMVRKGTAESDAKAHWQRMRTFASTHFKEAGHLFGAVDVGGKPYWWDYGQLRKYVGVNLIMTDVSAAAAEAAAMRQFFGVPAARDVDGKKAHVDSTSSVAAGVELSEGTVCLNSTIKSGSAKGCVIVNCQIDHVEAEGCILVNVVAPKVVLKKGVMYNVVDSDAKALVKDEGTVVVDIAMPSDSGSYDKATRIFSNVGTCGGKVWKQKCHGNALSFEEIYLKNQASDIAKASQFMAARRTGSAIDAAIDDLAA